MTLSKNGYPGKDKFLKFKVFFYQTFVGLPSTVGRGTGTGMFIHFWNRPKIDKRVFVLPLFAWSSCATGY
jgi:hypothetical protein